MKLLLLSLAGLVLFLWPFFGLGVPQDAAAVAVAVLAVLALVLMETSARRLDSRGLALLAALAAIDTGLRLALITGVGGFSGVFLMILCGGYVFGASYGFLVGAFSILLSAIVGGEVGPWLPYQVFAAGWVGAVAGLAGGRLGAAPGRADVLLLAGVGLAMGFVFGALLDLSIWTPLQGAPALSWMPGIEKCELEGDDRVLSMFGMRIVERQLNRDEEACVIAYGIVDGDMKPEVHRGTITVMPAGSGSFVTWDVETDDAMVEVMQGAYTGALGALKEQLES